MNKIRLVERLGITLSFLGIALVFQPFDYSLFFYGFLMLGIGGFLYVYSMYLPVYQHGDTTLLAMVKWVTVLVGTVVSFVLLSIYITPVLVS